MSAWKYHNGYVLGANTSGAHPAASENEGYAAYWRWLTLLGTLMTAIGLIIGVAIPGPITGAVFPMGITILLVVAGGARREVRRTMNTR